MNRLAFDVLKLDTPKLTGSSLLADAGSSYKIKEECRSTKNDSEKPAKGS